MLNNIPTLSNSVVCESCGSLTAARHSTCPVCGSTALWLLARVLDRERLMQERIDRAVERMLEDGE